MPVIANEPKRLSDLVKVVDERLWDAGYMYGFVEVAAGDYEIGDLLGTADGTTYVISDPAAVDGSEAIAAVVLENKDGAEAGDTLKVLVRGGAIVADKAINLGDHTLADATAALEAFNPPVLVGDQL